MKKLFSKSLSYLLIITQFAVYVNILSNQGVAKPIQDSIFAKTNAIILEEDNRIDITGRKAAFIEFNVSKHLEVKVLTQAGLEMFSQYLLPETFDPTYIAHFPLDRNYTTAFSNTKFNAFVGTITHADGTQDPAIITSKVDQIRMIQDYDNYYGNYNKMIYHIDNLDVGDVLVMEYSYSVKYTGNVNQLSSFRIFFNGDVFKEKYTFALSHFSDLNMDIEFMNEAEPDSTNEIDGQKEYLWSKKNVNGCINELGSRPYLSLPHVIFSVKPYELLYTLPFSFEERYIPFYAWFSYQREANHLGIAKSVSQGYHTRQYSLVDKFIANQTQGLPDDSLGYLKLKKVHHTIADEFNFETDTNYFKRIDTRDARMGDYLTKKSLRDISRYDTYVALILKMDLNYFTTYLCDKRSGEVSDAFLAPMYDSDYLFTVILKNNSIQYLYPKKARFGYYLNEIPFYYEGAKARLVHLDDYRNVKMAINENQRLIKLPNSNIADNTRRNSTLVEIDLDSLSTRFTSKINLTGQYSTMIRGLYLYDYQDESVNDLYSKKIWEINDEVEVVSQETEMASKEFPFPATVKAEYVSGNLIEVHNDTLALSLDNWFNHIIYPNFDTTGRQLDFYPDFCGKDSYVYYIQFNKNVHMISSIENVKLSNALGELIVDVAQVKPNTIKLSSSFKTLNSKVDVGQMDAVQDIFNKIQTFNQGVLLFTME